MNNAPKIPDNVKTYTNESVINVYCERHNSSKNAARNLFKETLKFLWSCSLKNNSQSPTKAVDEMWHVFILHTKDYQNFCSAHLGKFIHHHPLTGFQDKNCTDGGPALLSNCDSGHPAPPSNCDSCDEPPPCSSSCDRTEE
jgi:hypothetical protein